LTRWQKRWLAGWSFGGLWSWAAWRCSTRLAGGLPSGGRSWGRSGSDQSSLPKKKKRYEWKILAWTKSRLINSLVERVTIVKLLLSKLSDACFGGASIDFVLYCMFDSFTNFVFYIYASKRFFSE
jgi:hypothetical protein